MSSDKNWPLNDVLLKEPAFVLSRHWQETPQGLQLRYWLKSEQSVFCWPLEAQESVCFVAEQALSQWQTIWQALPQRQRPRLAAADTRQLRSLTGQPVSRVYSTSLSAQRRWVRLGRHQGLMVWEDDINPSDRFLMERMITASLQRDDHQRLQPAKTQPQLRVVSLDIETAGFIPGHKPDLYSIAVATDRGDSHIWLVDRGQSQTQALSHLNWQADEASCLQAFIDWILAYDPDVLVGWSVVEFDLNVLQQHCDHLNIPFNLGRDASRVRWYQGRNDRLGVEIEGRQVVDGPSALRSAAWYFEDFSLETVAQHFLGRGKAIAAEFDKVAEIERLYRFEPKALCRYNLEDAKLVLAIFKQAKLWDFLIERAHLTGLTLDRIGGSAAAFNYVYLPKLHRAGRVAPSVGEQSLTDQSPGGFVMDSQPGLYRNVLVLDFKSLYPSIIRTFLIDPLGLHRADECPEEESVPGFLSARFHRKDHLLPAIISQLWAARDRAKANNQQGLSQSIKIIMNSFYGVLGSNKCRFFDPRLASSITLRGHQILNQSRDFIEQAGFSVIYGDTDSLFISANQHPNPAELGQQLAQALNDWWRQKVSDEYQLTSHLEIEFETEYQRFLMPTIRGLAKGSKKRYAGLIEANGQQKLIFKGLEAVRSDWTPLAKQFQQELYRRILTGLDYVEYLRQEVAALKAGERDELLVYSRRLRRPLHSYQKNKPPHVQAALKIKARHPEWTGRRLSYRVSIHGVEPLPWADSPPDYQHYLNKQLAPIADSILHFLGQSFFELVDDQLSLW